MQNGRVLSVKIHKRREQLTQNLDTLAHCDIPVSRPVERTPADELKDQLNPGLKLGFEEGDNMFLARREQIYELPGMSLVTDVFDQSQHSSLMLPHGLVNHAAVAILLNWLLDGELVSLADIPEVMHNTECPLTEVPRQADWAHAGCGCAGVKHGWRKGWKTKLALETIRACCPLEKPADAVLVFLRSQVAPRHDNSEHERLVDLDDDGLFADGLVPTENPAEAAAYPLGVFGHPRHCTRRRFQRGTPDLNPQLQELERSLAEAKSKESSARQAYKVVMARHDPIDRFLDKAMNYRETQRNMQKNGELARWILDQLPLVEAELSEDRNLEPGPSPAQSSPVSRPAAQQTPPPQPAHDAGRKTRSGQVTKQLAQRRTDARSPRSESARAGTSPSAGPRPRRLDPESNTGVGSVVQPCKGQRNETTNKVRHDGRDRFPIAMVVKNSGFYSPEVATDFF